MFLEAPCNYKLNQQPRREHRGIKSSAQINYRLHIKGNKMKTLPMTKLHIFAACTAIIVCTAITGCTTATHTAKKRPSAGRAVLGISPHEKDIIIKAVTADGSPVQAEGCTVTEFLSGKEIFLEALGDTVVLKGKITELDCCGNQLTSLDVRGLTDLQELYCWENRLTSLNLQGLSRLWFLHCDDNQLISLNLKGVTALRWLSCENNRLSILDIHGLNGLTNLYCYRNRLKEQALIQIINSLPDRKTDEEAEAIFYTEDNNRDEGNCTDWTSSAGLQAAIKRARTKNWTIYKQDPEGDFEELEAAEN